MHETKYLVVGAGVSGLAFADWLKSDDVLVVERDEAIGGYCKTVEQDGFVWDYSGHFFHFRHEDIEAYLIERMQDQEILVVEKDSRIWFGERFVDFPFQKNIHQLPQQDMIDCLHDLYFKDEQYPDEPASFQEMLYKKFGRSIAEKFLIPYNEKLYATDLSTLDVDAMGRFFPYADLDQIIRNMRQADNTSYNATFTYPRGGAIQYVKALAQSLDPTRLSLNESVESIDVKRKIVTTTKREIRFEVLVSAAPLPTFLGLCGLPLHEATYSWNVVQVFNLGFDRKGPKGVHWAYYPQRDLSFYRLGFYDNIFGTDRMSMYVELGRPQGFTTTDEETAATLERVLGDLKKVGIVDDHELVSSHTVVLDPAYVHITKDSNADVIRQKRALATRGIFSVGRYGSWTYCSIEDNILEARKLAEACNAV